MTADLTKSIFSIAGKLGVHPEDLVDLALSHPAVKPYTDKTVGDYLKQGIKMIGSGSCNCNGQGGGAAQTDSVGAVPGPYNQVGAGFFDSDFFDPVGQMARAGMPKMNAPLLAAMAGKGARADTKLSPTTDMMGRHLQGAGFMKDAGTFFKKHSGKLAAGAATIAAAGLAHSIPRADSHLPNSVDRSGSRTAGKLGDLASKSGDLASGAQGFAALAEQLRRQQGRGFTENVQHIGHEAVRHVLKAVREHAPSEATLRSALKSAIPIAKGAAEIAKSLGVKPSDVAKILGQEKISDTLKMVGQGAAVGNEAMGGLGFKEDAGKFFKKHGGKLAAGIATIAAATAGAKGLAGSPSAPVRDNAWMTDTSHLTARDAAKTMGDRPLFNPLTGRGQGGTGFLDDFWTGFKLPFKYAATPIGIAGIATGNPLLGALGAASGVIGGLGCQCGRGQGGTGIFGDIGDWVSGAANDVGDVLTDTGKFIVNAPERAGGAFLTGLSLGAYRNDDTKDMGWLPFGDEGFVEKNTGLKLSTVASKGAELAGFAPAAKVIGIAGKLAGTGTIGTAHPMSNINEDATSATNWGLSPNLQHPVRGHTMGAADGLMAGNGSASSASGTSWTTANSGYAPTSRGAAVF
jgi:hypothetical protein